MTAREIDTRKLTNIRGGYKSTITRAYNYVGSEHFQLADISVLKVRDEALKAAYEGFVEACMETTDQQDDVAEVEEKYFFTLAAIHRKLTELQTKKVVSSQNYEATKLPAVNIPTFCGDYSEFRPFFDLFEAAIDTNPTLSPAQKLYYLRTFLSGEALDLIKRLPPTNENYTEAMMMLKDRYDNKQKLINYHINEMLDCKQIQKGTPANLRSFISFIKQHVSSLKNLNEPTESWGNILTCIVVKKLDVYTNRAYQFEKQTQKYKTLQDLLKFLEYRAVALEETNLEGTKGTSAPRTTLAVTPTVSIDTWITKSTGLMAVKLTALGRPQLLLQLSEVIMRARNYMQQIAGGTGNVLTHHKTIEDFQRYFGDHKNKPEVQEFMKKITSDKEGIVHIFPWSNILDEDMNLSDSFRVPDPKTGQMRRLISQISTKEEEMFRNMLRRLNHIIKVANERDVRVMIDAEQTYFQPAISRICLEMMRRYNKDKFLVFNTYQTYLKNTYNEIVTDLEQAQRQNFYWGAKLVRGAYIEQERARAAAMGYEDPSCENYEATTASFHKCLNEILSRVVTGQQKDRLGIMVASHNEDTVRYAIQLMKENNIKPGDKVVCFGQLLGMCDHITFPLGQAGYSAYKYVPYGPVVEVLPYLSRRANENRGFLAKIKKEKGLLLKEIVRRIVTGQMFYKPVGSYTPV